MPINIYNILISTMRVFIMTNPFQLPILVEILKRCALIMCCFRLTHYNYYHNGRNTSSRSVYIYCLQLSQFNYRVTVSSLPNHVVILYSYCNSKTSFPFTFTITTQFYCDAKIYFRSIQKCINPKNYIHIHLLRVARLFIINNEVHLRSFVYN